MKKSLSVVIPFFNEGKVIDKVYKKIIKSLKLSNINDYELIFVDDCSKDKGKEKIKEIIKKNSKVKLIRNRSNQGFANSLKNGFMISKKNYIHFVPGDDEHPVDGLVQVYKQLGKYDLIIPYPLNTNVRPFSRRIISFTFTKIINFLFFFSFPYYNGLVLYKSRMLKKNLVNVNNSSFGFLSELLIIVVKKENPTLCCIGYRIIKSKGKSKALKIKNIIFTILGLIKFRIYTLFRND